MPQSFVVPITMVHLWDSCPVDIYFSSICLSVSVCLFVCLFDYTNPQSLTDLDQSWYEASLGAGADQHKVADAFGQGAQRRA